MTTVYFIRHAEPNYSNHDDMSRELSAKGLKDRKLVTEFLSVKDIDVALSSPYKRAIDTIKEFVDLKGLGIEIINDFRERKVDSGWIDNFNEFCKLQWNDFNYKLSDGEGLGEVQDRNIKALHKVLTDYEDKTIVIGSHGTALSTIINNYDKSFGYPEFERIKGLMPWVVKFVFDKNNCIKIEQINLFESNENVEEKN